MNAPSRRPSRILHYLGEVGRRYFPAAPDFPLAMDIPALSWPRDGDCALADVALPPWAEHLGVDGGNLLVPEALAGAGEQEHRWRSTDWLSAIAWYLHGEAERQYERRHGPVHSYSVRLTGIDPRIWQRAWVNRIALFLRAWALRESGGGGLGPAPEGRLHLSHDVDAIRKTVAIRGKRTAFHLFNAVRHAGRLRGGKAWGALADAARFAWSSADYAGLARICELEKAQGLRSRIHVFAGLPGGWRNPVTWLIDPGYDIAAPASRELVDSLRVLQAEGWEIGLHPSAASYRSAAELAMQRERLEGVLGGPVTACRQHWLMFSWADSWKAQEQAGFREDSTLGFNDRPGFRAGAALLFRPWDDRAGRALDLAVLPFVFMDSQFYDYRPMTGSERPLALAGWVKEVVETGGECSCIWHSHVFGPDYGWDDGFRTLLSLLPRKAGEDGG
ncbi:MAG: hypothetical protein H7841_05485 [Magnetospirillum sp. WYHS-4]